MTAFTPYLTPAFLGESTDRYPGTGGPLSPRGSCAFGAIGRGSRGQGFKFIILISGGRGLQEAETKVCFRHRYWDSPSSLSGTWWSAVAAPTHFPPTAGNFQGRHGELIVHRDLAASTGRRVPGGAAQGLSPNKFRDAWQEGRLCCSVPVPCPVRIIFISGCPERQV